MQVLFLLLLAVLTTQVVAGESAKERFGRTLLQDPSPVGTGARSENESAPSDARELQSDDALPVRINMCLVSVRGIKRRVPCSLLTPKPTSAPARAVSVRMCWVNLNGSRRRIPCELLNQGASKAPSSTNLRGAQEQKYSGTVLDHAVMTITAIARYLFSLGR